MSESSRQLTVHIGRDAHDVYDYAVEPGNLPAWASGLGGTVEQVDGRWYADTPGGRIEVAFAPRNEFGVLDHDVTLPSGDVVHVPMRVIADGDGAEVIFTLQRQPDQNDDDYDRDADTVLADLAELKHVLER